MVQSQGDRAIGKGKQSKLGWGENVGQSPHAKSENPRSQLLVLAEQIDENDGDEIDIKPFNTQEVADTSPQENKNGAQCAEDGKREAYARSPAPYESPDTHLYALPQCAILTLGSSLS